MRHYKATNNDCLQCCLAAILDMALDEVPSHELLEEMGEDWYGYLYEWVMEEHSLVLSLTAADEILPLIHIEVFSIDDAAGHAVVMRGNELLLDPDSANTDEMRARREVIYRMYFIPACAWPQRRTS